MSRKPSTPCKEPRCDACRFWRRWARIRNHFGYEPMLGFCEQSGNRGMTAEDYRCAEFRKGKPK